MVKVKQKLKIYSVAQINELVKSAITEILPPKLTVTGEITGWKQHRSGHCYFSLKDADGVLPCVMWGSNFRKVKFEPENGSAVLASGYVDVYMPQGKYQLYVDKLEPQGMGRLQIIFEQMVKRLTEQGLFDDAHKKPLPRYPQRIGILTSDSGAALADIVDSIFVRWPAVKMYFLPVPVQGEGAAEKIADALVRLNKENSRLGLELIILGRGGGSLEDLWAFNEEAVAKAIYNSQIPVISAVGHEVDVTIADLVADARASTPTKAGVIAVPDKNEVIGKIEQVQRQLRADMHSRLELCNQRLETIQAAGVFRNPRLAVANAIQRLDELETSLRNSISLSISKRRDRLSNLAERANRLDPGSVLHNRSTKLDNVLAELKEALVTVIRNNSENVRQLENEISNTCKNSIHTARLKLVTQESRLMGLNPRNVLKRGYSLTVNARTGKPIISADDVNIGDMIETELAESSRIISEVCEKKNQQHSS